MDIVKELESIATDVLEDPALFLVDVSISSGSDTKKVKILVDGDGGIDIDQCANISRKVSAVLEESNLINNAFVLEVSSPGLDYPLTSIRQYLKNLGRRVKITLNDGEERKGELMQVDEDKVVINVEKKVKKRINKTIAEIQFSDIKKTNVLVSFK